MTICYNCLFKKYVSYLFKGNTNGSISHEKDVGDTKDEKYDGTSSNYEKQPETASKSNERGEVDMPSTSESASAFHDITDKEEMNASTNISKHHEVKQKQLEPSNHSQIEQTVSSAFQYEITKFENEASENGSSGASIDKKELEGMSSFFQRILANPFNKESEKDGKDEKVEDVKDCKTATLSLDNPNNTNEKISNETEFFENVESTIELNKEKETSEDQRKLNKTFDNTENSNEMSNTFNTGINYAVDLPAIPSPSKYEAIEALDEGDEQKEIEKWAERTETITRLEHER